MPHGDPFLGMQRVFLLQLDLQGDHVVVQANVWLLLSP